MVATSAPSTFASFAASNAASPFGTLSASGGSGAGFGGFGGANGSALGKGIAAFGALGAPCAVLVGPCVPLCSRVCGGPIGRESGESYKGIAFCTAGTGLRRWLPYKLSASVAVPLTTACQATAAVLVQYWHVVCLLFKVNSVSYNTSAC